MTAVTAPSATSPGARDLWRRARGPLIAIAVLLAGGLLFALVRSDAQHGRLDPRSTDREGSRVVAALLAERGVSTRVVTTTGGATAAASPDTTLLVADPDALTARQRQALHDATADAGGRTVLLAPGRSAVSALSPGVRAASPAEVTARPPDCSMPAARRAGDADLGGIRYSTTAPHAEGCYLSQGLPTLVHVPAVDSGDSVVLGSADILYNDRLDERGNASLALQLLGSRTHLVWYLPSLGDPAADGDDNDFFDLIPSGWGWGLLQLSIAGALAALWRGRRFGRLVAERLPVVVRASETVEGHARLYQRANARDRAATALRSATRTRIAPLVGVPTAEAHRPEVLCPAVENRLDATGPVRLDITSLLFGPAPTDDASLIRLTDQLDALVRRISSDTRPPRRAEADPPTDKDRPRERPDR